MISVKTQKKHKILEVMGKKLGSVDRRCTNYETKRPSFFEEIDLNKKIGRAHV